MSGSTQRFPIRFDSWYATMSRLLFMPPSKAFVDLDPIEVRVHMGWAFDARFERSAISAIAPVTKRPSSRGAHGSMGRWLVNGSPEGILVMDLDPPQRARTMGIPVKLRQIMVSFEDPDAFRAAIGR